MEKDEKMYLLIELRKEEGLNRKEFAKNMTYHTRQLLTGKWEIEEFLM